MYKLNKIIPNIVLAVLLATTVIICLFFYLGGNVDPTQSIVPDPEMVEPKYTGLIINFTYVLLVLVCVITVAAALISFITKVLSNPKSAMTTIIGVGSLAIILILSYVLGSSEQLNIIGYEGTQTDFQLKLSDMCLFTSYILFGIAVVVSAASFFVKRIF
jgi:hypothetical protein